MVAIILTGVHIYFRFVLLLRLGLFSRSLASRLKYPFCSFSSGSVLAGLLYMHFLKGF
jgi:hypothetical protein